MFTLLELVNYGRDGFKTANNLRSLSGTVEKMSRIFRLPLNIVSFSVLLVDQSAKLWFRNNLVPGTSYPIFPFFSLTYLENQGTIFGLFPGRNIFFIILSAVILTALFIFWPRIIFTGKFAFWGASLIVGGALGNLVDRILYGAVVDFLDFHFWPVFNLADSAITLGSALLLVIFYRRKDVSGSL